MALRRESASMAAVFSDARNDDCRGHGDSHGRDGSSHDARTGHNHSGPTRGTAVYRPPAGRPVAADSTPGAVGRPRPAARSVAVRRPRGPDNIPGHREKHRPTSPRAPGPQKEFQEQPLTELTEHLFSYA